MHATPKLVALLAATALAGLAHAQTGAAQTETVGGAQSNFAGTPLAPQPKEPGKVELPNVKAQSAPSAAYKGQPVRTFNLTNSWPKKVESAPPKPAALAPSAPQQGRVNKVDAITIKQGVAR